MDKEEILAKSRQEKTDEGMLHAENRGRGYGLIAFTAVFTFIIIFNLFNGQNSYAPMAMFWAFLGAEAYSKYRFTKQAVFLVSTIAGAMASVAFLGNFILTTLR